MKLVVESFEKAYRYYIYTWRLTELAIGAQRTAGEGRTVLERPNPKSETIRDYNLNRTYILTCNDRFRKSHVRCTHIRYDLMDHTVTLYTTPIKLK